MKPLNSSENESLRAMSCVLFQHLEFGQLNYQICKRKSRGKKSSIASRIKTGSFRNDGPTSNPIVVLRYFLGGSLCSIFAHISSNLKALDVGLSELWHVVQDFSFFASFTNPA